MREIEEIIAAAEDEAGDYPEDEDPSSLTWEIEDEDTAVKKTDRAVFLYREMLIPAKVQEFFSLGDLLPGKKRKVTLRFHDKEYHAFFEKTLHATPKTRLIWEGPLGVALQLRCPDWLEYFQKNRQDHGNTPSMRFVKRQEPQSYDVELEGAASHTAEPVAFDVPLQPGEVVDNHALRAIFRCSPQGAIRKSLHTDSLVLVSDHTRSAYEDKWIGRVFHFTGMGLVGEQSLSHPQNKALATARESGVRLWLFEVFREGQYVYIGEVCLAENPYRSRQPDHEKTLRDVYIFPLKLRGHNRPPLIKKELLENKDAAVRKKTSRMPLDELEFQARYSLKEGGRREVVSVVYECDPIVAEYAKRVAGGTCQLCTRPAPFAGPDGEPYLEVHHIVPLDEGGEDAVGNVAVLCPNCHRKMHVLCLPADVARLKGIAAKRN